MFWKFDLHTTSHIDTLLERGNVTLFELLDEEDVLQECKVVNRKLVDFLVQPEHMEALVTCVTEEPPGDVDERVRYKYPSVSCEILTSDVTQINDALGEDESLLRRLYSFLQTSGILNPLLASFFSKVMGILINRKTDQIVAFLRKKDDFVNLLLRHIGTSAIMDLLLRLLTCVEQPQLRQDVFNWLNEEKIVQRLIGMIHPSKDDNQHSNASQSLCDIIRLSREQMIQIQDSPEPDQLLATLEKQETIEQLLSNMLDGEQSESVIVNGIQVLLTLLEPRRPRTELGGMGGFYCNLEGQMEITGPNCEVASSQASQGTLLAIKQRLRELHRLLLDPPKKEALQTTWGILDPPLGNTRLHVVKLLASSLSTNNTALQDEIIELGAINTMLDLYFKYTYNNFLHAQVEACLSNVFSSHTGDETIENHPEPLPESPVIQHLLQKCHLIQRILSAWEENEQSQSDGGRRKGYMGHLTRVANAVVQGSEKWPHSTLIKQLLKELPEEDQERWEKFVSGPLSETNKKNTVDLVNMHNLHSSSDDDENDLKEFSFPQEAVLQQAFVDYQLQQMTSAFIDHFGFNDEEFGEQEENVNAHYRQLKSAPFDKTANISFSLNADDDSPNSNLFDICYKERIQQFDDDEEADGSDGEDIWQEKEAAISSGTAQPTAVRSLGSTDSEDSEDSEEGDGGEEEDPGGGDGDASHVSNGCGEQTEVETTLGDPSWTDSSSDPSSVSVASSQLVADDTGAAVWDQSRSDATTNENWASFTEPHTQQESPSKALTSPASAAAPAQEVTQSNISPARAASSVQQDPPAPDTGPPEGCDPPNPSTTTTVVSTVEPSPSTSDSAHPLEGTTEAPQSEPSSPQKEQQQQQPTAR
ncbi:serine/threonine-protein phosphatase 6 regulatory subunit 1 isoform X1 [Pogona vitticeps]|uniref:Serine/threonine-protein phosphatase 6 regulatory subunit 1 isoform X1 n=1 Tax=Pogona vitticeps TaxID=103695 RepID=A0A6J0TJ90_9SAUR|nr:serine/threonine-protein phosphatase 6 regulatory subunit 1 isoform X1 [Pogona vitticeps]XP_020648359.1 serine/threonine-protein phosphatase 6 regulatory subunit 1 isoform X1 [Pogona vitticeps]XP_020648360.1 serine/threonine-protein phosphatase 6 regulatory subunit 1 isoform X1 [Pogona vitticeps]XP_020648361.1 serine/threonine-protein phosphatase 6 regulatory subunit 1 isoform X1 [Pogona vitticeps]XP_020648362.1 serine/threonine-protein phosphatase 6 regulatory subunit 1 isoform X2 [Pogona v